MPIIEVRYRDISFEELDASCPSPTGYVDGARERWENTMRGRLVQIHTPPCAGIHGCKSGIAYTALLPDEYGSFCPCIHFLDIGD